MAVMTFVNRLYWCICHPTRNSFHGSLRKISRTNAGCPRTRSSAFDERTVSNQFPALELATHEVSTGWGKIFAHFSIGCQNSRKRAIEVRFAPKDAQEDAIFGNICEPIRASHFWGV